MADTPLLNVSLREEFCMEARPEPVGIVIFGASGDLSRRKLLPALFGLFRRGLMPDDFFVLGCLSYGDSPVGDEGFRASVRATLARCRAPDPAAFEAFLSRCYYLPGDYRDPEFYWTLSGRLPGLDAAHGAGGRRFIYLAVPPQLQEPIVAELAEAGLTRENPETGSWTRIVVEKPFGSDLASARRLSGKLRAVLDERQIYRIDHYLGKETVQNILMLRFANAIFEPVWNREHIDHVQITAAEAEGVGHRAGYYDKAGCLRDMFQNHMIEMLALVAMESPPDFDADRHRDEKVKLLHSIRPFPTDPLALDAWIVRGQHLAGEVEGKPAVAYVQEPGVAPGSHTETFVAMKLLIDNWRWAGVPFYLRSGKRLPKRVSEIAVAFKKVPHSIFGPLSADALANNALVMNVQPYEGISLTIEAKRPGPKLCMGSLTLHFDYRSLFGEDPPEAYERLLLDVMLGDQTLFVRSDGIEAAWSLLTGILETWDRGALCGAGCDLRPYAAGSWGPEAAEALLRADGRAWRVP